MNRILSTFAFAIIISLKAFAQLSGGGDLNLGPQPDGNFDPEQVELMNAFGEWIHKHSEVIYKTRGGPFYPFNEGVSTRKGKKAWLFITNPETENLKFNQLNQKLKTAKIFGSEKEVPFEIQNNKIHFDLSGIQKTEPVFLIELGFNKKVEMEEK